MKPAPASNRPLRAPSRKSGSPAARTVRSALVTVLLGTGCTGILGIDDDYSELPEPIVATAIDDSGAPGGSVDASAGVDAQGSPDSSAEASDDSGPDGGSDADTDASGPCKPGMILLSTIGRCIDRSEVSQAKYKLHLDSPDPGCGPTVLGGASTAEPDQPVLTTPGAAECYCNWVGKVLCDQSRNEWGTACESGLIPDMADGNDEWVVCDSDGFGCMTTPKILQTAETCSSTDSSFGSTTITAQVRCCDTPS